MSRWTTPVPVGVVQGQADLGGDPHGVLHRELHLAPKPLAKGLALHVGHGEPEDPAASPESSTVRMWGCCRRAAKLDLAEKALRAERRGELGVQHLERDGPVMLEVLGKVDRSHPAAAELALERVAAGQGGLEAIEGLSQMDCRTGLSLGVYARGSLRARVTGDCYRFCYSFSGQKRAFWGREAGTDARQVTISGQLDRNRCPGGTDSGSGESWFEPRRGRRRAG